MVAGSFVVNGEHHGAFDSCAARNLAEGRTQADRLAGDGTSKRRGYKKCGNTAPGTHEGNVPTACARRGKETQDLLSAKP